MSTCASRRALPFPCAADSAAVPCPVRRRLRGGRGPVRQRSRVLRKRRPGLAGSGPLERRAERRSDHAAVRQPCAVRPPPRSSGRASPPAGNFIRPARSTPSTSGPARSVDDGRPIRRQRRRRLDLPRPGPRVQSGRQSPLFPIKGARDYAAGKAKRSKASGPGRQHHRVHADGAAQHLPQVSRDAGRRGGADADAAGVRPGAGGQRAVAVRVLVRSSRHRAGRNPNYWAGPPKDDTPDGAHRPGGAHPGCRIRDGQPQRGRDPVRRGCCWEMVRPEGASARSCSLLTCRLP